MFLYIVPLKQGLKQESFEIKFLDYPVFIHRSIKTRIETSLRRKKMAKVQYVFIHRSIKTRIETLKSGIMDQLSSKFLYIDPLKQGLKPAK